MFPLYFIIVYYKNKYYLVCNKPEYVSAFKNEQMALNYFEIPWQKPHKRSYEWSMSACWNMISFNPCVVKIENEEIFNKLIGGNRDNGKFFTINDISGIMDVLLLDENIAKEMCKNGKIPNLINEI